MTDTTTTPTRRRSIDDGRRAARAAPPGVDRPLLPDARLGVRGRRRGAGDDGAGVAQHRPLRGPRAVRGVAVPHRDQRLPQPAARAAVGGPLPMDLGPAASPDRRRPTRPGTDVGRAGPRRLGPASAGRGPGRRGDRARVAAPGVRHRPAAPATAPAGGADPARRAALEQPRRWPSCSTTTDVSVKSALQRARATMGAAGVLERRRRARSAARTDCSSNYIDAFERYDIDALSTCCTRTPRCRCRRSTCGSPAPPSIAAWWRRDGAAAARGSLPVAPTASPAVAQYRPTADGSHEPFAVLVLDVEARSHRRDARLPRAGAVPAVRRTGGAVTSTRHRALPPSGPARGRIRSRRPSRSLPGASRSSSVPVVMAWICSTLHGESVSGSTLGALVELAPRTSRRSPRPVGGSGAVRHVDRGERRPGTARARRCRCPSWRGTGSRAAPPPWCAW